MCTRVIIQIKEKEYRYVYYRNENGLIDKIVVPVEAKPEMVRKLMAEYGAREPVVLDRRVVSCFEIQYCIPEKAHYSWGPLAPLDSEDMEDCYDDDWLERFDANFG